MVARESNDRGCRRRHPASLFLLYISLSLAVARSVLLSKNREHEGSPLVAGQPPVVVVVVSLRSSLEKRNNPIAFRLQSCTLRNEAQAFLLSIHSPVFVQRTRSWHNRNFCSIFCEQFRNFASIFRGRSSEQGSGRMPILSYCPALGSPPRCRSLVRVRGSRWRTLGSAWSLELCNFTSRGGVLAGRFSIERAPAPAPAGFVTNARCACRRSWPGSSPRNQPLCHSSPPVHRAQAAGDSHGRGEFWGDWLTDQDYTAGKLWVRLELGNSQFR